MTNVIELFVKNIEGEIINYSNSEYLRIYSEQLDKYFSKEKKLTDLANPYLVGADWFDIDWDNVPNPVFDVKSRMEDEGYFYQSLYSYKSEDGENGHGIYETPFAKIEIFLLNESLDFLNSDGVNTSNRKIVITLK